MWVRHQNYPETDIVTWADGLQTRNLSVEAEYSLNILPDLDLQFYGDAGGLSVVALFAVERFDGDRINALLLQLEEIVARMIEAPQAPLSQWMESRGEQQTDVATNCFV